MSKMKEVKWICDNCGNKFVSQSEDCFIDDCREHIIDCFNADDFIRRLN